jgi:tRNA(Ile)-lysidine synthase
MMDNTSFIFHLSSFINKKNLLAFSSGIDSSALFFLLIENKILFDIALVNYGTRVQSDREEEHAKRLAKQYNLTCHTIKAPQFTSHFEENARKFRYDFFETLINEHHYDTLLTAHQLGDQLEWFLMRLTKGAGVSELIGLEPVTQKEHYTLVRPLLRYSKEELLTYLKEKNHPYFEDESNCDEKYERNFFRKHFSEPLLAKYQEGIKRSFTYLYQDKGQLESEFETLYTNQNLHIIKLHSLQSKTKAADLTLKKLGYLLSASQRQEIAKENSLVIGGEWAIELQDDLLYIAPYLATEMPKVFKEECRLKKIPSKIRPYLFQNEKRIMKDEKLMYVLHS